MVTRDRSQPKIVVYNTQRDFPIDKKLIQGTVSFLLEKLGVSTDEIIIHFTTEKKISQIHADFFNDPTSTDCITFPIDLPEKKVGMHHVLGECFICPKVALAYASKYKIPPLHEVLRYVIHCLLHLIGYDDLTPKERTQMKRKERQCLKMLAEILED
ncbi:MAG: rRNA maturation RNase YbeY [Chlamydiota bacterium]